MSGSRPSRAAARDAPPTRTTELAYRHQLKPVMVKGADGSGEPVAWVTLQPVSDAGKVWAALSNAHPETGLVPTVLSGLDGSTLRPWDDEEFDEPADATELLRMDAASVLQEMWDGTAHEIGYEDADEEDEGMVAMRAPFSKQFPGLAPAKTSR